MSTRDSNIYDNIHWCEQHLPYCAKIESSTDHILLLDRKYRELWVRPFTPQCWALLKHRAFIDRGGLYVHFWADGSPPWISRENRARCLAVLDDWNVGIADPFMRLRKASAPARAAAFSRWGRGAGEVPGAECWVD